MPSQLTSRKLPPASTIFFAFRVMNVRRPNASLRR
jgi:hypothetical protein